MFARGVPDVFELRRLLGLDAQPEQLEDGTGVHVAIIDSSFQGYAHAVEAGFVPQLPDERLLTRLSTAGLESESSEQVQAPATGHGVAVLEIMSALAPRAQYTLIKVDDYAQCVEALELAADLGANVIHNSFLQWTNSWGDGEGPLVDAVNRAHAAGCLVVVPAGNGGRCMYWGSRFAPAPADAALHAWDANDLAVIERPFGELNRLKRDHRLQHYRCEDRSVNPIGVRFAGNTIKVYAKWDRADPDTAYEVVLVCFDLNRLVWDEVPLGEQESRRAGQRPVSVLRYVVPDQGLGLYGLRVRQLAGAASAFHIYLDDAGGLGLYTPSGSLGVPGDAAHALVIGAARPQTWPSIQVPDYSARGPTKAAHAKPDLAGPSSIFLRSVGSQGDVLEGTCSASSTVAAIAALAWQALCANERREVAGLHEQVTAALLTTARRGNAGQGGLESARAAPASVAAAPASARAADCVIGHGLLDAVASLSSARSGRLLA